MTLFYPDISGYNRGVSTKGAPAVCAKATEGDYYISPDYERAKADAAKNGVFFFAYHFLVKGRGAAQADYCFKVVGKTPLMLDVETSLNGSMPGPNDVLDFMLEFTKLGGVVHLVYLPHWYWRDLGSPDLTPLKTNGLHLVSSDYTAYSDTGPGWDGYGGIAPDIWQYTSSQPFNGYNLDFNAFRGTLAELKMMVEGTVPKPPPPLKWPTVAEGASGNRVKVIQYLMNSHGGGVTVDGIYGPATKEAVFGFQLVQGLAGIDGITGPETWAALTGSKTARLGDKGDHVKAVQLQVKVTVDGAFGPNTLAAVEKFQSSAKLAIDGIVGPNTWEALAQRP